MMKVTEPARQAYAAAEPFPHIVLDNFWDTDEIKAAAEGVKLIPEHVWLQEELQVQQRKKWVEDLSVVPPEVARVMKGLFDTQVLQALSAISGIPDLLPEPALFGAGVHRTSQGGRLAIHTDFNTHPSGLYRRLNLLLYLNKHWHEDWGGGLELWTADMAHRAKTVPPVLNRAVIFTLSDVSFHGHPDPLTCPDDEARYSFAAYYYTEAKPDDFTGAHNTCWQRRPGSSD